MTIWVSRKKIFQYLFSAPQTFLFVHTFSVTIIADISYEKIDSLVYNVTARFSSVKALILKKHWAGENSVKIDSTF